MVQDIIVYIIIGLVILEVIRRIAKLFLRKKGDFDPCAGCAGCETRDLFRRKQEKCLEEKGERKRRKDNRAGGCSCGCGCH